MWKCRNIRIDGLLDLADGGRIGLEIKYRMNWEKACQAGHRFCWYRRHNESKARPIDAGIVVFEEFSGDWARRKKSWLVENGWSFWYMDHQDVEGLRVDLVRLRGDLLESFPAALARAAAATSLA